MVERGIVTGGTGGVWTVRGADGTVVETALRGRLKQERAGALKLAVGDEVRLAPDERGGGAMAIVEILPRRSQLARRQPGGRHGERVVVANVDQVVVVFAAARPEPHPRMLDRFLVIAEGNALPARVVVNKVDLADDRAVRAKFAHYEAAGYPLHLTSVAGRRGLAELGDALAGRISVLTGPSGVGKSSLLNALFPGLGLRVGEISESVNKGRHTTVGASLHPLPNGGFVADTPGLREVGMWGLPSERLDVCFPEFRALIPSCRFADCKHLVEPECAVRSAVAEGAIASDRWESYRTLREELESSEKSW